VLVFIDDDCKLDRDYLRDLERHYRSGEKWLIRGGRVELGDARDLPFTIKRCEARERLTPAVHPGGFVLGCNMTMHRDVAARIGPFDERFGAGGPLRSAEDTDYLVRAMLLGMPDEYVPDMTVLHHHGRRDRKSIDRLHRDYSLGNGALCLKHVRHAPWLLRHGNNFSPSLAVHGDLFLSKVPFFSTTDGSTRPGHLPGWRWPMAGGKNFRQQEQITLSKLRSPCNSSMTANTSWWPTSTVCGCCN